MTVRHITVVGNVDSDGYLVDPTIVHHGTLQGSCIASLAGPVDPTTHLNSDFHEHELGECVIATELTVGAELVLDEDDQFERTHARHGEKTPLGHVDLGARRTEWLQVLRDRRN